MSERIFPEEGISVEGNPIRAMKISCSHCGAVAYYPHQTGIKRKPPIAAQQYFQNKGWAVGTSARKDFCPLHARPSQRKARKPMTSVTVTTAPLAEPPRECSREDRRIIMEKLDEVYGKDAYKAPWTDQAVASDLGVPRDWVTKLRDEFFGPAGSNPVLDEYLAGRDKLEERWKGIEAGYIAAVKALDEHKSQYLAAKADIEEMRRIGRRIEREIGR